MKVPSTSGPETGEEKYLQGQKDADRLLLDPSNVLHGKFQRRLTPGEPLPDRRLGVPGGRDVRGVRRQPSETDLLLALAEMHRQGRFSPPEKSSDEAS